MPIDHVVAIYARENGQGMAFPVPNAQSVAATPEPARVGLRLAPQAGVAEPEAQSAEVVATDNPPPEPPPPAAGGRPSLKRIK